MDVGRSSSDGNRNLPGSSDPHVQEVVKAAHEELRLLMRQRADVMKRIGTVKADHCGAGQPFRRRSPERGTAGIGRPQEWRPPARLHQGLPHGADGSGATVGRPRGLRTHSAAHSAGFAAAQGSLWRRSPRCSTGWWNMAKPGRWCGRTDAGHGSGWRIQRIAALRPLAAAFQLPGCDLGAGALARKSPR